MFENSAARSAGLVSLLLFCAMSLGAQGIGGVPAGNESGKVRIGIPKPMELLLANATATSRLIT